MVSSELYRGIHDQRDLVQQMIITGELIKSNSIVVYMNHSIGMMRAIADQGTMVGIPVHIRISLTMLLCIGLFTADQVLRRNDRQDYSSAIYTRQNPNGNRRGYECPEERDYYPYWHPTPWRDIAILADNETQCEMYRRESNNRVPRGICQETYRDTGDLKYWSTYNNERDCRNNSRKLLVLFLFNLLLCAILQIHGYSCMPTWILLMLQLKLRVQVLTVYGLSLGYIWTRHVLCCHRNPTVVLPDGPE